MRLPLLAAAALAFAGCATSSHATAPSTLGTPRPMADLLAVIDQPGPVKLESVVSADWAVDLSGLLNLDDPKAKAAGLEDRLEPIQIWFHALHHPERGLFIVDTGVEKALRDDPDNAAIRGIVGDALHRERMKFRAPLGEWLGQQPDRLSGVFFTHLHLDHIGGAPDVPHGTPLYAGPGETAPRAMVNVLVKSVTDRALEGQAPLSEWQYGAPVGGLATVDVFGDGSVWALWVPGHTPGSSAYVVRTPEGPVLLVGDTCHTRWGWENHVEPGGFTGDHEANRRSLEALEELAAAHPAMQVRLGHQRLKEEPTASPAP